MTIEILEPKSRDEWLEIRARTIGASEVAALLGLHPYMSRLDLWMTKSGNVARDIEESAPMRRGRLLEPVAVQVISELRPDWRIEANPMPGGKFYRDLDLGISCTPDMFATDPARAGIGVVQIKSVEGGVFRRTWKNDAGEVEPPMYAVIQAITEASLTGASWAQVAGMVVSFGVDLELVEAPLHDALMDKIKEETHLFWESIASNTPPPADYGKDGALIAKIYPSDNGQEVDLSGDNALPAILEEREKLKAEMKAAEERVGAIDTEIKTKLGAFERGHIPGWAVSWKLQNRKAYSVEATSFRKIGVKRTK